MGLASFNRARRQRGDAMGIVAAQEAAEKAAEVTEEDSIPTTPILEDSGEGVEEIPEEKVEEESSEEKVEETPAQERKKPGPKPKAQQ